MKSVTILAAAFACAVAMPVAAQQVQPAEAAKARAAALQLAVGQSFEGGVKIQSVVANEDTVVITMDGPANWREGLDAAAISSALVFGFCQEAPDAFFADGVKLRVVSLDSGKAPLEGPVVAGCPAKPGE